MSVFRKIAAKIGGQFAANHKPAPGVVDMASVSIFSHKEQIQPATINWLNKCIERGATEIFSTRILLNPGVANALLERNPENRSVSLTKVEHYAKDMVAGRWDDNGETIIVSSDGLLNDGQHRMMAVVESNTSVPMTFVFGVSRRSRTTVDQGVARGVGHYLSMEGRAYARNISVAARWIMAYEASDGRNISQRAKFTNSEVLARCRADDALVESAAFAYRHYKLFRSLFSHTVMTVAHYILRDINEAAANEYLDQLALGENLRRGDPALAVRNAFMASKRERQEALEIIFHGWNAYRSGRKLVQTRSIGAIPAVF